VDERFRPERHPMPQIFGIGSYEEEPHLKIHEYQAKEIFSRYGVPSPVKRPDKLNVVIFRENTEDIYAGIE
jgi:hypothetical protein